MCCRFKANSSESAIFSAYQNLLQKLHNSSSKGTTLRLGNAVALQGAVNPAYLDLVKSTFDAAIFSLDFSAASSTALNELNSWVREKTNGKIPKMLDSLERNTKIVLLNAIYFKGSWKLPFPPKTTAPKEFNCGKGQKVIVPMMHLKDVRLCYAEFDDGQLVELPYQSGDQERDATANIQLCMYVFLPKEQDNVNYATLSEKFAKISSRFGKMFFTQVNLAMPRFKVESFLPLNSALQQAVGIQASFNPLLADFGRMEVVATAGGGQPSLHSLYLSSVFHRSVVEVNEEGSEAAAATVAIVCLRAMPMPKRPVTVILNRPFLFLIRDRLSQVTFFAGVLSKP